MTTVLICSFDSFEDAWAPALSCLDKYWPDCPFPIRTMSNFKPWGKNPLLVGRDISWTANLRNALDHLSPDEFVITWLDDMLLCRPVNTFWIQAVAEMLMTYTGDDMAAIRLGQGNEKTTGGFVSGLLAQFIQPVAHDSEYRISTSPTLWRQSYLRQILDNCGETAWDFETKGTEYSRTIPGVIAVPQGRDDTTRPVRQFYTGITRGRWNRGCLSWLKQIGIDEPDLTRGVIEEEERGPQ